MLRFLLKVTKMNKLHNHKEKLVVKRETQDSFSVSNDVGSGYY